MIDILKQEPDHEDKIAQCVTSGPSGKFCNSQSPAKGSRQGALRGEWQALSKKRNAELIPLRGSPWASPQAKLTVLCSLELATASPALARLVTLACGLAESYRTSRLAH